MLFGEIVIVALQSIRANLFRATLTMLGIIIGVGAVITMLAAGAGAQKRIDDQIAALGANILTINASNFFAGRRLARSNDVEDPGRRCFASRTARYLDAVVPELQTPRAAQAEQHQHERAPHRHERAIHHDLQLQARAWAVSSRRPRTSRNAESSSSAPDIPERLEVEPAELLGKTRLGERPAVRGHRHSRKHRRRLRQQQPGLFRVHCRCARRSNA